MGMGNLPNMKKSPLQIKNSSIILQQLALQIKNSSIILKQVARGRAGEPGFSRLADQAAAIVRQWICPSNI
jgi:hypothetical protein